MKSSARGGPGKYNVGLRAAVAPIKQPSASKAVTLPVPSILRTTQVPALSFAIPSMQPAFFGQGSCTFNITAEYVVVPLQPGSLRDAGEKPGRERVSRQGTKRQHPASLSY